MEDILASIRRILNDEEPGAAPAHPALESLAQVAEPPLALTEAMLVTEPTRLAAVALTPSEPLPEQPALVALAPVPPPPVQAMPAMVEAAPPWADHALADQLLAPAAAAAASAAMGQLMRAVTQDRGAPVQRSGGPSIEDVVREELRPMLKQWLDQHMPPMVERLVRAEIERVVSRALS